MQKTIQLGKVAYESSRQVNAVELTVELRDTDKGPQLSVMGGIWNARRTDYVSCGQNVDEVAGLFPNNPTVQRIKAIWERWHLNGMKAGCTHQRAEKWDQRPIDPSKPTNAYGKFFPGQRQSSWNMLAWITRDEHPEGLLSHPCPVCGYKYGSAWLHEEIPADVQQEIEAIIAQPIAA